MTRSIRRFELATYGVTLGLLLCFATAARAEVSACWQCLEYWTNYAISPGGPCSGQNQNNRQCINPILQAACTTICENDYSLSSTTSCVGMLPTGSCFNDATGPCTWDTWNLVCDMASSSICIHQQLTTSIASPCNVSCVCGSP